MSLRILHVIDHLGYGGAPMVVKNIAERIDISRFETSVCALRTNPRAMKIEAEVINLEHGRYDPLAIHTIARLCKHRRIDILHCHLQKSVVAGLIAASRCSAKIVIHEHGPIFRGGTGCIYRMCLRCLGSRATAAIANSEAAASALSKATRVPLQDIPVIANFIDFRRFDPARHNRNKARANLGITDDEVAIGFVGRLNACKGVDTLLQAASILCKKGLPCRFIIIGEGSERESLEKLSQDLQIERTVTFTGLCENTAELMAALDVAVVPSRREAFGIVAVEFMRMRVPVIAAGVGGLPELIEDGKTGILLEDINPQTIAEAVEKLAADDSIRAAITDGAEIFCRKFDGKEQIQQIMDLYDRLGGSSPQPANRC